MIGVALAVVFLALVTVAAVWLESRCASTPGTPEGHDTNKGDATP